MKKLSNDEINAKRPTRSILTAIGRDVYFRTLICKCNCGALVKCSYANFTNGLKLSCGCLKPFIGMSIGQMNAIKHPESCMTAIKFGGHAESGIGKKQIMIIAKCSCGKIEKVRCPRFLAGAIFNCFHFKKKPGKSILRRKNQTSIKIYECYRNMIQRCYNKQHPKYRFYGAKGVSVCKSWRDNYDNFKKWALDNGWEPGLQIDKDTIGNGKLYSPKTCCFLSRIDNNRTKKTGSFKMYFWKGKERSLKSICLMEKAIYPTVCARIRLLGLSLKESLTYKKKCKTKL